MREAAFWRAGEAGRAHCALCPHLCSIAPGEAGACGVRRNLGGVLYAESYEEIARLDREPVERLPLFHFRPGSLALAVGSAGENLPEELVPPARPRGAGAGETRFAALHEVIDIAAGAGIDAIACSGGEPFMWFEQWRELAERARAEGIASLAVTNAYASEEAARAIAPLLDAANVLFLGPARVYERRAGARLDPVLRAVEALREAGVHLEATFLVLPGANDDAPSVGETAEILAGPLGAPPVHVATPLSLEAAAPVSTILRVAGELRARLPHVYVSNVWSIEGNNSYCRVCRALLVDRMGPRVAPGGLSPDGACRACGAANGFRMPLPSARPPGRA